MTLQKKNRLSPYYITDDLIRVQLYQKIRETANEPPTNSGWFEGTIQPNEALMPELTAYRIYRTDTLKWLILIITGVDDMRDRLQVGETFNFPPAAWVREQIKIFEAKEQAVNNG